MKIILMILILLTGLLSLAEAQSGSSVTDPAIRAMEISMNTPNNAVVTDPASRSMLMAMNMSRYLGNVPFETIIGKWQLNLSDRSLIYLALLQSGAAVFGKGEIAIGNVSQGVYASGSVSGSSLHLEIVPDSGLELYVISVDISSPPFEGNYVVFTASSEAKTGTLRAYKNMPTIKSTVIQK